MNNNNHGGKRQGAGRPTGSKNGVSISSYNSTTVNVKARGNTFEIGRGKPLITLKLPDSKGSIKL